VGSCVHDNKSSGIKEKNFSDKLSDYFARIPSHRVSQLHEEALNTCFGRPMSHIAVHQTI
jgi:hypothetical protein